MDDKPKNLCLDLPQFNVRKPYHLEIDNDSDILYPECEKINGINIVKPPKLAFEQLEKMLQDGFKRDELASITAIDRKDNLVGRHIGSLYPILAKLANTGKALVFDIEDNGFDIKDTVTDATLGNLELSENENKELQIVRVKSRHNSLDNLEWIPRAYNVKKYKVNGLCDLGMTHKELIGQTVELVKIHKSGLYQIKDISGHLHNIPKRNLDSVEE